MGESETSDTQLGTADGRRPLLLSVDFEDWHQLIRRRIGTDRWQQPGPALRRQTDALLTLLDELGVRATFFVLGMAARAHPELVQAIAAAGHELGCHGDAHLPVHAQTPSAFEADLRAAQGTIEEVSGRRPVGYRAPAFSITRDSRWAYDVLVEAGFGYDASEHDTPRGRDRVVAASVGPHRLDVSGGTLWEFPVAVWRAPLLPASAGARLSASRSRRSGQGATPGARWGSFVPTEGARSQPAPSGPTLPVPVGGASYWAVLPTGVVLHGLRRAGPMAGLYLHPYELDPEPLRARLPGKTTLTQRARAALREGQRNLARRRAAEVLRAIAGCYRLITYGEAHAQLSDRAASGA